jgi:hypothetical protein
MPSSSEAIHSLISAVLRDWVAILISRMAQKQRSSQKLQYNLGTWKGRTVCVGTIPAKQKNKP